MINKLCCIPAPLLEETRYINVINLELQTVKLAYLKTDKVHKKLFLLSKPDTYFGNINKISYD
jgi:hypothetical protein